MKNKTRPGAPGVTITDLPAGGVALEVKCLKCGEPIIGANKFGMYCKNRCDEKENKEAMRILNGFFSELEKLIDKEQL